MPQCDVNVLLADAACFGCLTKGQLQAVKLSLLCDILAGPLLSQGNSDSDPTFSNGDPSLNWNFGNHPETPPEDFQYDLSVVSANRSANVLSWTFPAFIINNDQFTQRMLYLQRSTTRFRMPKVAFDISQVNQNFYDRSGPSELATAPEHDQGPYGGANGPGAGDVGWTTIASWDKLVTPWPFGYTDVGNPIPPADTIYGYRLLGV